MAVPLNALLMSIRQKVRMSCVYCRNRDFDVIEHSFEKQGDKIEHEFLLKQKATELLLIANVIQEDGECLGFSFGRIAQN